MSPSATNAHVRIQVFLKVLFFMVVPVVLVAGFVLTKPSGNYVQVEEYFSLLDRYIVAVNNDRPESEVKDLFLQQHRFYICLSRVASKSDMSTIKQIRSRNLSTMKDSMRNSELHEKWVSENIYDKCENT